MILVGDELPSLSCSVLIPSRNDFAARKLFIPVIQILLVTKSSGDFFFPLKV